MRYLFLFSILFLSTAVLGQVRLTKGMKITKSTSITKAVYKISGDTSLQKGVIEIAGNNIVVDFKNAVIVGSNDKSRPDEFYGLAISVKGSNITIKNLFVKGFKVALMAKNVHKLTIENCDFSYNYRQHLNSTQEKEDISDWMSYHRNEEDQWLRYGAAIYLRGCHYAKIKNNKVTGGQNALMMTECNNALVYNNDFSFNSGIGIGLYKSSYNQFLHNRVNFNVRGYSHGIYNRGQDSAGFLVYEQSNGNLFYKNSATHSGDGFFLWAGQTTMDTGKGGCNDNQLIENDFSYAPTNGIEVTFSSNKIVRNRIYECDHGIWGGYSFNTAIANNQFRNNRIAIAIEHGQNNIIDGNIFYRDKEAIRLWARAQQPADWGYAKYRDTRSVDYLITLNSFNNNDVVYNLSRTDSLKIFNNRYSFTDQIFKIDSTVTNIDSIEIVVPDTVAVEYTIKGAMNAFQGNTKYAGRKNIMITEWGPYDFRYPLIWNTNPTDTSLQMNFKIFGPKGMWKIVSAKGIEKMNKVKDSLPSEFSALKLSNNRVDIEMILEYAGQGFTDPFGNKIPANKPYRFAFRKFFQPIDFAVSWYAFDSTTNPIKTDYLERVKTQRPFKTESANKLDYAWWGGIKAGEVQHKQFLTIAEGTAEIEPGNYELGITWDDAVRVYVDGKLLVDEWNPSKYTFDESPNKKVTLKLGGTHVFRVEHVELGGFATLSLKLNKAR
jgi:parallel beta-helix repeat protein